MSPTIFSRLPARNQVLTGNLLQLLRMLSLILMPMTRVGHVLWNNTCDAPQSILQEMINPAKCVDVAVKTLSDLNTLIKKKITDPTERENFILSSYNSSPSHMLDAVALAQKYGLNAHKWDDKVETAAIIKSKLAYYRDPFVKMVISEEKRQ